ASCSSRHRTNASGASTASTINSVRTATTDVSAHLGLPKASGIEGLPVPDRAVNSSGDPCPSGGAPCRGEVWTLPPEVSVETLVLWYRRQIPSFTAPWHDWASCANTEFIEQPDAFDRAWYKEHADLFLRV